MIAVVGGVVMTPLLLVLAFVTLLSSMGSSAPAAMCPDADPAVVNAAATAGPTPTAESRRGPSGQVNPELVPKGPIAGYGHEQLVNAAWVMAAGQDQGVGDRGATIGVMTAMGESGLRVLPYGDAAGPDSRGLFQQRGNGAWGSLADRMDPYRSSVNFFLALKKIPNWSRLEPTIAAHRVQRNQDPRHYAKYWPSAVTVVAAVKSGVTPGSAEDAERALAQVACETEVNAWGGVADPAAGAGEWVSPARGPVTSRYGPRRDPITGAQSGHTGTDLVGGGCKGPIWAAHAGVVTRVWQDSKGGWTVRVDHGGDLATSYKHMYPNGIHVRAGDQVQTGQRIAAVGSSGWSTGCHLHFEVFVRGTRVNPEPFMASRGVRLGESKPASV